MVTKRPSKRRGYREAKQQKRAWLYTQKGVVTERPSKKKGVVIYTEAKQKAWLRRGPAKGVVKNSPSE